MCAILFSFNLWVFHSAQDSAFVGSEYFSSHSSRLNICPNCDRKAVILVSKSITHELD
jgi:hypothetical protein